MQTPLFARQPIFNRDLDVIAYELLFRNSDMNKAGEFDGDHASSHVLLYAFGEHRIEDVIGNTDAYINFTQNLLTMPPPLPPDQLVIEVLEDVKPSPHVIQSLKNLREQGYRIALDDFFLNNSTKELLKYADIIKIDVLTMPEKNVERCLQMLKPLKIQLLAEKVETHEHMQRCVDMGFDSFQGYFLSKPQIIKGVKAEQNHQSVMRLLAELTSTNVDFDRVVDTIAADSRISFKILNLVNSSAISLSQPITSLKQAVSLLGLTHIRNWATFLVLASDDNKPTELSVLGTTRAKFCELLAAKVGNKALGETGFTTGLLSSFDAFLDLPIEEVVNKLNLSDEIRIALTERGGVLGQVLDIVLTYERGDWDKIKASFLSEHNITESDLSIIYTDAISWASSMLENA